MTNSEKPKTMNQIISDLAEMTNQSKKFIKEVLDAYHDILNKELFEKQEVKIASFGKIKIKSRPQREGINPATGKKEIYSAKTVPKFLFSKNIKEEINEKFDK